MPDERYLRGTIDIPADEVLEFQATGQLPALTASRLRNLELALTRAMREAVPAEWESVKRVEVVPFAVPIH